MKAPIVIGITGPTGAGKSALSSILAKEGYKIIDADKVYARLVAEKGPCIDALSREFGAKIVAQDGTLKRAELAKIVFSNKEQLEKLNRIAHPFVIDKVKAIIRWGTGNGNMKFAIDAPALFESGADQMCSITVAVLADRGMRLGRIKRRDHLNDEMALLRMSAQHDDEYYREKCEYIIYNNGDTASLKSEAQKLLATVGDL